MIILRWRYLIIDLYDWRLLQIITVMILIDFHCALLLELRLIYRGKCLRMCRCARGRRNLLRLEIVLIEACEILLRMRMS